MIKYFSRLIKSVLNKYKNNVRFKQVVTLLSWNFLGIPLSIFTNIIITRFLGSKNYGDYMFINNVFNVAILILNFGLFQAANRALVLAKNKQTAREYYGAELIIATGIYLLIVISLFIFATFDKNIQDKGIKTEFFYVIPFACVYLFVPYFETLFQADNRIDLLVRARYLPKLGFFATALLIYFLFGNYVGNKLFIIWSFYLSTQILVYIYIVKQIKVSFQNIKVRIKEIFNFNKKFGFNVYVGSLFSNVFAQLAGVLISYFGSDNAGVGYYSLALTLVGPLSLIPNVIATTHYKDFATIDKVPKKLLKITLFISLSATIALLVIIPPFIHIFYKKEFSEVIKLSYIASVGVMLYGLSDFFNRFLGSHGDGKALRNSSILVGISILVFNAILIPILHEVGAAITYLISGVVYFSTIIWYYRKMIKNSLNSNYNR
jgi:O-antigen/teichoic acid export membrane protein